MTDDDGKEARDSKLKAHLVQGVESQLLKSLIAKLSEGHKPGRDEYVVLALHDGCVSRVWKDPRKIQEQVANGRAAIEINIDCEQYNLMDIE